MSWRFVMDGDRVQGGLGGSDVYGTLKQMAWNAGYCFMVWGNMVYFLEKHESSILGHDTKLERKDLF